MESHNPDLNLRLSLVRHGVAESNVQDIECADIANKHLFGLTEDGREQMRRVAANLPHVDHIYCSPLLRTVESARILADKLNLQPIEHELLIEQNVGIFELQPEAQRIAWKEQNGHSRYPGGETPEEVIERGKAFLAELRQRHAGEHILVVSHNMFLQCLALTLFNDDRREQLFEDYFLPRRPLSIEVPRNRIDNLI